jgi:Holliday junction resolvasome RuvABC DNA-binding subunit
LFLALLLIAASSSYPTRSSDRARIAATQILTIFRTSPSLTTLERTGAASANGYTNARSSADDAVSALLNLGYKPIEAKRAVDSVDGFDDSEGLESLIRRSLAIILGEK